MSRSRIPVSAKQLAANRANAARSTCPRTLEGKANSAQNSRQHGFTDSTFAIVREERQEVGHLTAGLLSVYQPVNAQEPFAIERIALAQQAILRAARLDAGLFTSCLNEALDPEGRPLFQTTPEFTADIETTRAQTAIRPWVRVSTAGREPLPVGPFFYAIRSKRNAITAVRSRNSNASKLSGTNYPNEPIFGVQPEPDKTSSPLFPTNPNASRAAPLPPSKAPAALARVPLSSRSGPAAAWSECAGYQCLEASAALVCSPRRT